jgi:hypothetical protein
MAASGTTKKITSNQILGAGGTATLASATITGDLTVDTNVLKVNSTTNKVGVNTTTLTNDLTVQTSTAKGGIHLNFSGSTFGLIGLVDPGVTSNNTIIGSVSNNSLELMTNNSTKATLDTSGNLSLANGNLVMTTSGKGIDFSATSEGSGTMTSELLNDYEEGTFTPTVIGTTTAGTATYSRQLGRYTKVGNLVTIQIYLAWSAGTGVGNLAFSGLPFTIANNANEYATATIGFFDSIALTALNIPTIIGPANDTKLQLWQFPVGGGAPSQVPYDAAGSIILTSTYIAA